MMKHSVSDPSDQLCKLLLVGGGHTHVLFLRQWMRTPLAHVQLTLVSNAVHTPYSGMLPGFVAGFYTYAQCHIDLKQLTQFAQVNWIEDEIIGLNLQTQEALCHHHSPLAFDLISIDIGSTPAIPDVGNYGVPIKPVSSFIQVWHNWLDILQKQQDQQQDQRLIYTGQAQNVGIIGGGTGGVELALAIQTRLQILGIQSVTIHLFHQGERIASHSNSATQARLTRILVEKGIQVHLKAQVSTLIPEMISEAIPEAQFPSNLPPNRDRNLSPASIPSSEATVGTAASSPRIWIECQDGMRLLCDRVFWVTHASAPAWLQTTGLALDPQGFIQVQETLQSTSHPFVFAVGDIAALPCPKAGVFAVRQAKPLWHNVQRWLQGQKLQPYHPQKHYLSLIGTGVKCDVAGQWQPEAIATWGSYCWGASTWIWQWKRRIDQRFMQQFQNLQDSNGTEEPLYR